MVCEFIVYSTCAENLPAHVANLYPKYIFSGSIFSSIGIAKRGKLVSKKTYDLNAFLVENTFCFYETSGHQIDGSFTVDECSQWRPNKHLNRLGSSNKHPTCQEAPSQKEISSSNYISVATVDGKYPAPVDG